MRRPRPALFLAVISCIVLVSCSSDDPATPDPGGDPSGVGIEGGVVSSSSGDASVSVPSGAISGGRIDISVDDRGVTNFPQPGDRRSSVFEFGPEGTQFDFPVMISIALADSFADSTAVLHRLNDTMDGWDPVPLSYVASGRVWGQTSGFSVYSAGPGGAADACNVRDAIAIRVSGSIDVAIADQDARFLIAPGTAFEQETGSRWITQTDAFTVSGIAGPPEGTGKWIDFATGPEFETGEFDIGADGSFSFDLDIPALGFRFLGLTDACGSAFATPENGWYYNLEVWCGVGCPENDGGGSTDCDFPSTVTMANTGFNWVEASFSFLEDAVCDLGLEFITDPLTRVIRFQYSESSSSIGRNARAIQGAERWNIVSSSAGILLQGQLVNDLPDATDVTFELQDADDAGAPSYRMVFRFDGNDVMIKSFVEIE